MTIVLILVSAGEVVLDDGGDDPVQPCLIFSLPVIYFRNPVDPYNL